MPTVRRLCRAVEAELGCDCSVMLLHEDGTVLSSSSGGLARLSARCALLVRRSAQRHRDVLRAARPPAAAEESQALFPAFLHAATVEARATPSSRWRATAKKRRSVEFLLAGESVKQNRHLARFAAAPYLAALLEDSALDGLWRRKGGSLRKELIEAYVVVEALEERVLKRQQRLDASSNGRRSGAVQSTQGGDGVARRCSIGRDSRGVVIDLCSGKGFLSVIIAHEFPNAVVLSVDNNPTIQPATAPNTRFVLADIMQDAFLATLREQLAVATTAGSSIDTVDAAAPLPSSSAAQSPWCVALGVHLCGPLSPRAITLFEACEQLDALVLVPCCLDPRTDGLLKAAARAAGEDPYDAKVEQLAGLLRANRCGHSGDDESNVMATGSVGCRRSAGHMRIDVSVARDSAMRTNKGGAGSEGSTYCKNAVVVGLRVPGGGCSDGASSLGVGAGRHGADGDTSTGKARAAGLKRGRETPPS